MMKCIIVDDEPIAREGMKMNIGELSNLTLVGEFEDAALQTISKKQPSRYYVFGYRNARTIGLDFLRSLDDAPMVILTTAYPQYAVEA